MVRSISHLTSFALGFQRAHLLNALGFLGQQLDLAGLF